MSKNKFSETVTVFGYVDRILREKPNISLISQEAYVMFCYNKTLEWLQGMTENEKNKLLSEARKHVSKLRCLFQHRRSEIEEKRSSSLEKNFKQQKRKNREGYNG